MCRSNWPVTFVGHSWLHSIWQCIKTLAPCPWKEWSILLHIHFLDLSETWGCLSETRPMWVKTLVIACWKNTWKMKTYKITKGIISKGVFLCYRGCLSQWNQAWRNRTTIFTVQKESSLSITAESNRRQTHHGRVSTTGRPAHTHNIEYVTGCVQLFLEEQVLDSN